MLKEADYDRITGDAQTALNEDSNFYGISGSFQKNLPPALKEYTAAAEELTALLGRLADPEKPLVSAAEFETAALKAREASFKLWEVSVDELDVLLEARVASFRGEYNGSVAFLCLAVAFSSLLLWLTARSMNRSLIAISQTLADGVTHVAEASEKISGASQELAQGCGSQAASLQETSAALVELTSMVRQNAENAEKAKKLSSQTRAAADSGAGDVRQMSLSMAGIRTSSDEVAKIARNIDEIAFQTNILALNAAVEAARAGEAGAGFAVVADEVRNLAQRSAFAARETAEKIEAAIRRSHQGVEVSERVAASLQEIIAKARAVDDLVGGIAAASSEQATGIQQINQAVIQMDKITQTGAATADVAAQSAFELNDEVAGQRDAVGALLRLVHGSSRASSSRAEAVQAQAPHGAGFPPATFGPTPASQTPSRSRSTPAPSQREHEAPREGKEKDDGFVNF
ncbi:MAG: hypothetical protein HY299_15420 [Verrucomicrobia bacterium]|nr:hypothetical protein [Verrucomicrobiota bacterium]